jgi:hypothetical protein
MIVRVARRAWLAVRRAVRGARKASHEQVHMRECLLLTSAAETGPLRWVPSPEGHRLAGSYLPAPDPSETGP